MLTYLPANCLKLITNKVGHFYNVFKPKVEQVWLQTKKKSILIV